MSHNKGIKRYYKKLLLSLVHLSKSISVRLWNLFHEEPEVQTKTVSTTPNGIMPEVFTPFNNDLTVNYEAIPVYAKYLSDSGIDNILVGAANSESTTLPVVERKKIINAWVAAAKKSGIHVMVQIGGASLADAMELAFYCEEVGANSILALAEVYCKPSTLEELMYYVSRVANSAPNLAVFYYHLPVMSKVQMNMSDFVAEATAGIPNFMGVIFTSYDLNEGTRVLKTLKDGQRMLIASDTSIAQAAVMGIKHSTCVAHNFFPKLTQDILMAVENNDLVRARELEYKLSFAVEALKCEGPWLPSMKAGMEMVTGVKVGPPNLPNEVISKENKKIIKSKLSALGLCNKTRMRKALDLCNRERIKSLIGATT